MWYGTRRINVRRSWELAKRIHADVVEERNALQQQMNELLDELASLRDEMRALKVAVLARQNAEQVVAELRRQRDIERAQAANRDPALPLQ